MQSGEEELKSLRWDTILQCLDSSVIEVLGYHFVREIIGFIPVCSLQTLFLKAIIKSINDKESYNVEHQEYTAIYLLKLGITKIFRKLKRILW